MTALEEAREHLAAALRPVLEVRGVPLHVYPPGSASPPFVVIVPGSPYRTPGTGWGAVAVALNARIVVSGVAADAARLLDTLIDECADAIGRAAGVAAGQVSPPRTDVDTGTLSADLPTAIVYTKED